LYSGSSTPEAGVTGWYNENTQYNYGAGQFSVRSITKSCLTSSPNAVTLRRSSGRVPRKSAADGHTATATAHPDTISCVSTNLLETSLVLFPLDYSDSRSIHPKRLPLKCLGNPASTSLRLVRSVCTEVNRRSRGCLYLSILFYFYLVFFQPSLAMFSKIFGGKGFPLMAFEFLMGFSSFFFGCCTVFGRWRGEFLLE
jgi:hypothetical protein